MAVLTLFGARQVLATRLVTLVVVTAVLLVVGSGCMATATESVDATQDLATSTPTATTTEPAATPTLTAVPTVEPTAAPEPTLTPTAVPTTVPTTGPTLTPTAVPSAIPTTGPTATPAPTLTPTVVPTAVPTTGPTATASASTTPLVPPSGTVGPITPDPTAGAGQTLGDLPTEAPAPDENALAPVEWNGTTRALLTESGAVLTVRGGGPGGWDVVTPCFELATVASGRPISGTVDVLIDPGHGGNETGAVGANGLRESDLNLDVSLRLVQRLESLGYRTELTRHSDHRMAIQARTELANALAPSLFISIHHNGGYPGAFDRPGTEVFYQQGDAESQRLGGLVFEEIQAAFADIDIDWVANNTFGVSWRANRGGTDLYGILRRTPDLVTVLTEAMFLTNPPEAELLERSDIRDLEADALAAAIDRWFVGSDGGTGYIEGLVFQGDLGPGGGTGGCVDPPLE